MEPFLFKLGIVMEGFIRKFWYYKSTRHSTTIWRGGFLFRSCVSFFLAPSNFKKKMRSSTYKSFQMGLRLVRETLVGVSVSLTITIIHSPFTLLYLHSGERGDRMGNIDRVNTRRLRMNCFHRCFSSRWMKITVSEKVFRYCCSSFPLHFV